MGFCTNQVKKLCCFQYVTVIVRPFGNKNSSTAPLTAPSCLVPSLQRLQSLSGLWPTERTYMNVNDLYIILKSSSKNGSSNFCGSKVASKDCIARPESYSKVARVLPRYSQPRPAVTDWCLVKQYLIYNTIAVFWWTLRLSPKRMPRTHRNNRYTYTPPQARTYNHGLPKFRQVWPMASMPQDPPSLHSSHALHRCRRSPVILSSTFWQPQLSTFGKTLWCYPIASVRLWSAQNSCPEPSDWHWRHRCSCLGAPRDLLVCRTGRISTLLRL